MKYKTHSKTPVSNSSSHSGNGGRKAAPIHKTITKTGSNFRTAKNTVCFGGGSTY